MLSSELRQGSSEFLARRRGIVGLSLFSCAVLGAVALYQMGILKKLPQPNSSRFSSEKVHGSAVAYSFFETPDALLGLASYAVTACMAGIGPVDRSKTQPLLPLAMGLKVLVDAGMAGKLTWQEIMKIQSYSIWSLLTWAATSTALPLALPEAKAALANLRLKA